MVMVVSTAFIGGNDRTSDMYGYFTGRSDDDERELRLKEKIKRQQEKREKLKLERKRQRQKMLENQKKYGPAKPTGKRLL